MKARRRAFLVLLLLVITLLFTAQGQFAPEPAVESAAAAPLQQTVPTVSFNRAAINVTEPDSGETETLEISVIIGSAPAQGSAATVSYATANGSATAGVDYTSTSGQLTFPVGSTDTQTFEITILGNNLNQPDREFVVFLTNPVNATVGIPGAVTITILDNDPIPATNTPTATPGGPVYLDEYEPNNSFGEASTTSANAAKLIDISLWPVGDEDYFQFFGKKNSTYEVFTTDLTSGLDTFLRIYDPEGNKIAENDDIDATNLRSQLQFSAKKDGNYFARITNKDPSDSSNKSYSFGVNEVIPPTATPTSTRVGQPDICEPNNSLNEACLIGPGEVRNGMNFIPYQGAGTDNDFYFMPVKPGILYTCETQNLSAANDTNIIFLDNNGNDFNPQLGNDDRALGDPSSLLSYYSTYTGNLNILVGPVNPPSYADSPLYTYDLRCSSQAATPTPLPTATFAFIGGGTGGGTGGSTGAVQPTAPPFETPTVIVTPTPIDIASLLPTPVPPPIVGFQPLPTSTPAGGALRSTSVQVTIFYDSNFNFMPELTEGIADVAVELFDNSTGQLLAFGYTNEAGVIRFEGVTSSGAVRVDVAYINFSQVVTGSSANILLRVEPRPLPSGSP
ncbi:MAG: Calx-beta domain-containing protein [Candidatus Promineifilaceae bacterium]